MAHDFAKTRARKAPEQKRQEPAPQPAKGMLITGLLTGLVLGFFSFFLIYLSGVLPPVGSMLAETSAEDAAELAAAQQRRTEELEQAAARLQLEFYRELPNYEVVVDSTTGTTTATPSRNTISATAEAIANAAALASAEETVALEPALTAATVTIDPVTDNQTPPAINPESTTVGNPADTTAIAGSPPAIPAATPIPGEPAFMLQAGAFQQEAAAVAQSMRLNALGLDAGVKKEALLGKTLFLVQAGPYYSREQLNQAERLLRSNSIDSMRIGLSQ